MSAELPRQGFAHEAQERLPMPHDAAMNDAQRAAAQSLLNGPRKGVYGPFLPLLRAPQLLDRIAKTGEYLRFESVLDGRIRELATCAVARHTSNQFEWVMHAPLAVKAGVTAETIAALAQGARPKHLSFEEEAALDFVRELMTTHGVSDQTYKQVLTHFGEQGVVELSTLVGYFTMVCWVMNVARTPANAAGEGLAALPA
jgi:4-carboxymuconolactone decarboxylase